MKLKIVLNGTDVNPWHRLGLTQNPFPQLGRCEYDAACLVVQSLGGDPIPDTDYIRNKLRSFDKEFVDLLCSQFRKGEIVRFTVEFPVERS